MKIYSFEKLECWQHARLLTGWIYEVTQLFPVSERFGLTSQMGRASISIASNLAEGTSRKTEKDQAHFSTMAYSSTVELLNQLTLAMDLKYFCEKIYSDGRDKIEKQTLLIAGLRKSQYGSSVSKPLNS